MLTIPICETPKLIQNQKLKFYIILENGTKKNLLTLKGIKFLNDFSISWEINKPRTFEFTYGWNKEHSEINTLLGDIRNEIQVFKDNELIFDGYINSNQVQKTLNESLSIHKVQVLGTEQQFLNAYVSGLTTFINLTSKEILEKVSKEYHKKYNHDFKLPVISNSLNSKWSEALNIDGQYSRLFDIIKDRENAQYIFKPKGEAHWFLEKELALSNDEITFINGIEIPHVKYQNDTKVNRVDFKYKEVKGSLFKEKITNIKDNKVLTINPIYDIKYISINGDKSFIKTINQNDKDKKTFSFNENEITITGVDSISAVEIQYWIKDSSGVVTYDNEKSITNELVYRENTSTIHQGEISNERIGSMSDVLEYSQKYEKLNNVDQYTLEFSFIYANIEHELCQNLYDFKKYKFNDNNWHPELKGKEFYPHKKTLTLLVSNGCEQDFINVQDCKMYVELETSQQNRWQTEATRDKIQYGKHQQNTININLNHDWDIGNCSVYGGESFNKDILTNNGNICDVTANEPKGYIQLNEKLRTQITNQHTQNNNLIKCSSSGRAYLVGKIWFEIKTPNEKVGQPWFNNEIHYAYFQSTTPTQMQTFLNGITNLNTFVGHTYYIYDNTTKTYHKWRKDITTGNFWDQKDSEIKLETKWVSVDVEAHMFDKNSNTLATSFDVPIEWGITYKGTTRKIDNLYLNPGTNDINYNNANIVDNSSQNVLNYSQITSLKLDVNSRFGKFTNVDNSWFTNLNASPKDTWDDQNCTIKKEFKHQITTNQRTGNNSPLDNFLDWINPFKTVS